MLLITSAAYLNPEFTAEFGRLPPAFLPLGTRRLIEWQVECLGALGESIHLSLPEGFEIGAADGALLKGLGIDLIRVPAGLSLGASVVYCVNVTRSHGEPLRILHGDTLVEGMDLGLEDVVGVGPTTEYYPWAECVPEPDGAVRFREGLPTGRGVREVLCGYFSFSDASRLVQSISRAQGSFIEGLNVYAEDVPLEPHPVAHWYDFGHVHLYYQSKSRMMSARSFNRLDPARRTVRKSSADAVKIRAEAAWYNALPADLRLFTPKFLGELKTSDGAGYEIEYLFHPALNELFVFGQLPTFAWSHILGRCDEFLSAAAAHPAPAEVPPTRRGDYLTKTLDRLERFAQGRGLSLEEPTRLGAKALPSLRSICEAAANLVPDASQAEMTMWHGDFCFSNILYDFRADQIRVIDPRGLDFAGRRSMYGDRRYDVAKLAHSAVGRYDAIVARRFRLQRSATLAFELDLAADSRHTEIAEEFRRMRLGGVRADDPAIAGLVILLFLSMLPLHDDDETRQLALLANALRLFAEL